MNTQKKTIYKIHKKTFSSFIPAAVITLALMIAVVAAFCLTMTYGIDRAETSAESAEKSMISRNAGKAEDVDLASALREDAVEDVLEAETIPAYSYDEC